jgi:hypothetical protein
MRLMDTIIGRQNLQQLPPDQQDQARSEATRQFWLNTLLSGRGLAGGFAATQQVIPSMQAANQQQRMEQARQQSLVPTGNYLGPRQGSQLDLIRAQMGDMIEDPQADAMTTEALQRRGQGTGIGGTGLTAEGQLVPEMELDPARFAELASQAMPASDVQGILRNFEAVRPKINDQGVMTDIRGRVIGSIPTFKDGTQTQLDARTGGFVAGAVPGYRDAQMSNYVPNLPDLVGWQRDAAGNISAGLVPGGAETMATTGTLRALSEAAGQTEPGMINGVPGRLPRSAIVGSPQQFLQQLGQVRPNLPPDQSGAAPAGAPAQRSGMPGGFVQTERTAQQETLDMASQNIFKRTGDEIFERASKAGERLFQMEELYNAAESIDPNALTSIAGTLTPYLRLLPGFNDSLAQFGTDFSLLRQRHNRGILRQFESDAAKGNLNKEEVNLFKDASWAMNDPKEIIQYIAATETALADKDLARRRFYEQYIADGRNPSQFNTAWENAPENTRIYDHPMFIRFLTDRVNDSLSKPLDAQGNRPMPILPPGHKLVQNNQGQLGIRNPDGRVIPIGQ